MNEDLPTRAERDLRRVSASAWTEVYAQDLIDALRKAEKDLASNAVGGLMLRQGALAMQSVGRAVDEFEKAIKLKHPGNLAKVKMTLTRWAHMSRLYTKTRATLDQYVVNANRYLPAVMRRQAPKPNAGEDVAEKLDRFLEMLRPGGEGVKGAAERLANRKAASKGSEPVN